MEHEDIHFRYHRNDDSDDHLTPTPSSEFALPQRLVNTESTSSSSKIFSAIDEEKAEYFPQEPMASISRINSVASGYSIREIYGDMSQNDVELARRETRDTVRSHVSNVYSEHYIANDGMDTTARDGSEFKDIDPELITWDGPDDPENPRNWKFSKKFVTTAVVAVYTMISPLSSSILSPAVPAISEEFGITNGTVQALTVSIFILAWAICPLFMAPLSEVYGRQIVLNGSIVLLFIFNVACAVSQNTAQMLVFRFLAGMAGAPPISVGAGTLADLFNDEHRSIPMALYSLGPSLGPVIAPIISGWLVEYTQWRWVFWTLSIINGVVAGVGLITYRETFAPTLLDRKARKLRKLTGNDNLHTVFDLTREPLSRRLFTAVTRPIIMLFTHPIIAGLGLYMAFVYGFMYLMLVTYPALWSDIYHYKPGIGGMMYLGLGIGTLVSVGFWTPLTQKSYMRLTARNNGQAKPEYRLALVWVTAVILGCALIWYGWSTQMKLMWLMPVVGTGIFGFGLFPVFQCIQNYLIDMNPKYSASAVAAAAVFRSCFGFGFPLFGTEMYTQLGYGWANTLCGILMFVLGIPFPIVIYFYGERVRRWTDERHQKKAAEE
jgi:multidrug resistance protein